MATHRKPQSTPPYAPEDEPAPSTSKRSKIEHDTVRSAPKTPDNGPTSGTSRKRDKSGTRSEHEDDTKKHGLQCFVPGILYQLKLQVLFVLNSWSWELKSFNIASEERMAGKFDDIVLEQVTVDGAISTIYIQAKHTTSDDATVNSTALVTGKSDQFLISKYFTSFLEMLQPVLGTREAQLVICTNSKLADEVKKVMEEYTFQWEHIQQTFRQINGRAWRFNQKEMVKHPKFKLLLEKLRTECSEGSRLAKALAEHIFEQKQINLKDPLFKKYRSAIVSSFLQQQNGKHYRWRQDLSTTLKDNFRAEFEKWYRALAGANTDVWEEIKRKQMIFSDGFLKLDKSASVEPATLPDGIVSDELINDFFNRLVLVTDTMNEDQLTELCQRQQQKPRGTVASRFINYNVTCVALEKLKHLNTAELDRSTIHSCLDLLNLKGACAKPRTQLERQLMQLNKEKLAATELYGSLDFLLNGEERSKLYTSDHTEMEAERILDLFFDQNDPESEFIIVDKAQYLAGRKTISNVHRQLNCSLVLVIVCPEGEELDPVYWETLELRAEEQKHQRMLIILNDKIETPSERFLVSDLEDEGRRVVREKVRLYGTHVLLGSLVESQDELRYLACLVQMCDKANRQPSLNDIRFKDVEGLYIMRRLMSRHSQHVARLLQYGLEMYREFDSPELQIHDLVKAPNKTVIGVLDAPGCGKTTYLKWLAKDLETIEPDSWIVRFCAIQYAKDFALLMGTQNTPRGPLNATRILFRFIYLLLNTEDINFSKREEIERIRERAFEYADAIIESDGTLTLDAEKVRSVSPETLALLRLFKAKYCANKLIVLFDGFDEIAPHYTETALALIGTLQGREGIRRLCVTSRPYGFQSLFEGNIDSLELVRLKTLTNADRTAYCRKYVDVHPLFMRFTEEERIKSADKISAIVEKSSNEYFMVPLFLKLGVEYIVDRVLSTNDIEAFLQPGLDLDESLILPSNKLLLMEYAIDRTFAIDSTDKEGKTEAASYIPKNRQEADRKMTTMKKIYSLLAMDSLHKDDLLDAEEQQTLNRYTDEILSGTEKPALVVRLYSGVAQFVHRMFAEYFVALWLYNNWNRSESIKFTVRKLLYNWDKEHEDYNVQCFLNAIVIQRCTHRHAALFSALINNQGDEVLRLYAEDPTAIHSADVFGRTPLHVAVVYFAVHENPSIWEFVQRVTDREGESATRAKDQFDFCFQTAIQYILGSKLLSTGGLAHVTNQ
uniref:NACHT domain-containing protein n=1 Tax=Anopheles melas TaxID=34690 RepID=A0A182TVC1_9DIPT